MIHYHGTPITPESAAAEILLGRHAMVSFSCPRQVEIVAMACQSFTFDNGAFNAWKQGRSVDWEDYRTWVYEWRRHPGLDWVLIPDVIDGGEKDNDALLDWWEGRCSKAVGVPVWHMHESLQRLVRLAVRYKRVALGSSAEYATVGTDNWWKRIAAAMDEITVDGQPITKLHGLRMLNPAVFTRLPFASADSTNVARNIGIDKAWKGTYTPATKAAKGIVIASRIEAQQSSAMWGGL